LAAAAFYDLDGTLVSTNLVHPTAFYLLNQATPLATAKKLGLPRERLVVTVERHGNTSAASVPLALDEFVRAGKIRAGHRLLLSGVGGGFTWGASLVTM